MKVHKIVVDLDTVKRVAIALEELNEDVIFIGGAVIGLYVTDEGAEQPRPTKDIDVSVQINSYRQMDELRVKLASKNIYPAPEEKVTYRFSYEEILIDFIPFEDTPLGPTNRWLKPGFTRAYPVQIGEYEIKILPVSFFLATKWEAFINRGHDYRTSHDFEDIIYILDNNQKVVDDIEKAPKDLQVFLKGMGEEILSHQYLNEIIGCHIEPYTADERSDIVIEKLRHIASL